MATNKYPKSESRNLITIVLISSTFLVFLLSTVVASRHLSNPQPVQAATNLTQSVTLSPTADSFAVSNYPTTNYGTNTVLKIRQAPAQSMRSYLRFNISSINPNNPHVSTKLRMRVRNAGVDGGKVFFTTNNWTESGLNWNNAPANVGFSFASQGNVVAGTWVEFDLSQYVKTNGTYNFMLVSYDKNLVSYDSREGKFPPQLVVTQKQFDRVGRIAGPTRVALIGDSLTAVNYGPTAKATLQSQGYNVAVYGAGGTGILDANWCQGQVSNSVLGAFDPDIVVFENVGNYIVTPHCNSATLYNTPAYFTEWQQSATLQTNILRSKGARFYWVLNPPMPPNVPASAQISSIYSNIAASTSKVGTIDAYLPFGGTTLNTSLRTADKIHLNAAGITLMSNLVTNAINAPAPVTP